MESSRGRRGVATASQSTRAKAELRCRGILLPFILVLQRSTKRCRAIAFQHWPRGRELTPPHATCTTQVYRLCNTRTIYSRRTIPRHIPLFDSAHRLLPEFGAPFFPTPRRRRAVAVQKRRREMFWQPRTLSATPGGTRTRNPSIPVTI